MDKRKYPRASFRKPVKYHSTTSGVFEGQLAQDLSEGGIRINTCEFLALGSVIYVQIQLAELDQVFDLDGKVVWVRELEHMDGYQLGIEFTGGRFFEKWKIAQYVYRTQEASRLQMEANQQEDDEDDIPA